MNTKRKSKIWLWILVAAVLVLIISLFIYKGYAEKKEVEQKQKEIEFPYEIEDGKLELNSLFQFTGFNPDCNNEEGEDIASLTVVNKSNEHLAFAEIKAKLSDDRELLFEVKDLPAGQSVMVFEKNNESIELSVKCMSVESKVEFEEKTILMEDKIAISVKETEITLTNISDKEMKNLFLHCHCMMDETYFGGLTYKYPVEKIPAGESVTIQADDCYLGEAVVVQVTQGKEEK